VRSEGFRRSPTRSTGRFALALFHRIDADKARYPILLSNGDLLEQGDLPNGRHYALWPIASQALFLFASLPAISIPI